MLPPAVRKTNCRRRPRRRRRVATTARRRHRAARAETFTEEPYKARPRAGRRGPADRRGERGPFGTYASGGIALTFSDVLGDHLLGTSFGINGGFEDIGAQVIYVNRTRRDGTGACSATGCRTSAARPPPDTTCRTARPCSCSRSAGAQTYRRAARSRRIRSAGRRASSSPVAAAHRLQQRDSTDRVFDPVSGAVLAEEKTRPAVGSVAQAGRHERGADSGYVDLRRHRPDAGQRMRLDLAPTLGDLQLIDFTRGLSPVLHAGPAGHLRGPGDAHRTLRRSAEDARLSPLFLGYPEFVRGYDIELVRRLGLPPAARRRCAAFDRLVGSRPWSATSRCGRRSSGSSTGGWTTARCRSTSSGSPTPAWRGRTTSARRLPATAPSWVGSVGVGARVNLLGLRDRGVQHVPAR